jgi:hypothetical protein
MYAVAHCMDSQGIYATTRSRDEGCSRPRSGTLGSMRMYHRRDGEIMVCSCRLFVEDITATESNEWCVRTRRQQWAARNTAENMIVTKSEQVRKRYSAIMDDSRARTIPKRPLCRHPKHPSQHLRENLGASIGSGPRQALRRFRRHAILLAPVSQHHDLRV